MTDKKLRENPRDFLFALLRECPAGMLGVDGSAQHMQPMTHFTDDEAIELWFITSISTDLVRAVGQGARAQYCLIDKGQDAYACLAGTLEQVQDDARLDALWSPMVAAWFDKGRDDPKLSLLRLTIAEASLWSSDENALKVGFEIARANLAAEARPDLGDHVVIRFT